jgi:hypothetical protein
MKTFFTILFVNFSLTIFGQNSASHQVTINVPQVLNLRFHSLFTSNTNFVFNNAGRLNNGIERIASAALEVRANKSWTVSVKAMDGFFSNVLSGLSTVPCSIVQIKRTLAPAGYMVLSTVDQPMASGNRGGWDFPGNSFTMDYKITPGLNYSEGTYTLPIVFTLSSN